LDSNQLVPDNETNSRLEAIGKNPLKNLTKLSQILRRPEISLSDIRVIFPALVKYSRDVDSQVEVQIKYEGYVNRQNDIVERFQKMEDVRLPEDIDYSQISGISREVREKLIRIQPRSLGQASRISGITPAAITLLSFYLKKRKSA
jgi:tRNA uridine 5-carboxymethylaminomethyl modification enzyme